MQLIILVFHLQYTSTTAPLTLLKLGVSVFEINQLHRLSSSDCTCTLRHSSTIRYNTVCTVPATMSCLWESSRISYSNRHQSAAQFRRASCSLSRLQVAAVLGPISMVYNLHSTHWKLKHCKQHCTKVQQTTEPVITNPKAFIYYIPIRFYKRTTLSLKYVHCA